MRSHKTNKGYSIINRKGGKGQGGAWAAPQDSDGAGPEMYKGIELETTAKRG